MQPISYDKKWFWIRLNIMTNYFFVKLSGNRCEEDSFVHLSFKFGMLLVDILMEKNKSVISGEHDFDYIKSSTLIALYCFFAVSRIQCKKTKKR